MVTLTLVVNTLSQPTINKTGDTLTTQTFVSYQWLKNDSAINGATLQSLNVTSIGNYKVIVSDVNGCSDTSTAFNVISVGIENAVTDFGVRLYPNPNSGSFTLEFTDDVEREIEVTDAIGRLVLTSTIFTKQERIDLNETAAGIYILNVKQNGQLGSLKLSLIR